MISQSQPSNKIESKFDWLMLQRKYDDEVWCKLTLHHIISHSITFRFLWSDLMSASSYLVFELSIFVVRKLRFFDWWILSRFFLCMTKGQRPRSIYFLEIDVTSSIDECDEFTMMTETFECNFDELILSRRARICLMKIIFPDCLGFIFVTTCF